MALSWTDLGLILAASLWMAVPFLLALCLCVLVEMLFPSEELSLRERLPGALFVLALPVSETFIFRMILGGRIMEQLPVFIRKRTPGEIAEAKKSMGGDKDPQADDKRTKKPEWLVVVGICTHLGCIPLGQRTGDPKGDYNGWFCPCHGSMYDTSGRIRVGPAPRNLAVPPYDFISDTVVKIG